MKKKLVLVLTFILVMTIGINVKASNYAYEIIEKSEDSRALYNEMPTEVKKGDIVKVKISIKNVKDMFISDGDSIISFDSTLLEPVESDGVFYKKLNDNVTFLTAFYDKNNTAFIYYSCNENNAATEKNVDIAELYFKVKNTAPDGVYKISQIKGTLSLLVDNDYENQYVENRVLQYQLGKPKLKSVYTTDYIPTNSYVIGSHLFTREKNSIYDGRLRTQYIMIASKSIQSDDKNDMIIYAKNADGIWLNAITGEEIDVPEDFDIEYVNLLPNYIENGVYTDSNENTILRLIQISETEAIVTIENESERIHGMATVSETDNGKVAKLIVANVEYNISILEDGVSIATSDTYITNKNLQKRTNNTMNDYFIGVHARNSDENSPIYYINSSYTGKYVSEQYEVYFLRTNDEYGRVCIKEKDGQECLIDEDAYIVNSVFRVQVSDAVYTFAFNNGNVTVQTDENGNIAYSGTYTKVASLTMEDTFRIWEKSTKHYYITIDENNGENLYTFAVLAGEKFDENNLYAPYKELHQFVEWQLNGTIYDFSLPVTSPFTLVAKYTELSHECYSNAAGTEYYWTQTPSMDWVAHPEITSSNDCVAKQMACYKDSNDEYYWTNSPLAEWTIVSSASSAEQCIVPVETYLCYNYENVYQWSSSSPGDSWTVVNTATTQEACAALQGPMCYEDSDGGYHWTAQPDSTWSYHSELTSESTCRAPACYSDGNNYYWTNNPESNWTTVNELTSQDTCVSPTASYACYLHDGNYVWGGYENTEGYSLVGGITSPEYCVAPTSTYACYHNNGTYVWTDNPENSWSKLSGITIESDCITGAQQLVSILPNDPTSGIKRYSGNDPDNYVWFNGEQWRIIGVYNNSIKIIRATPLSESIKYNNSQDDENAWDGSNIQTYLNSTYYSTLSETAKELIYENGLWIVGSVAANDTASQSYSKATNTTRNGKVGLIASFEYLYGAESTGNCWTTAGDLVGGTDSCSSRNWLYHTISNSTYDAAWTINPSQLYTYQGVALYNGQVDYDYVDEAHVVSPVVYLKPTVRIMGGNGKVGETNSYKLGF